jgi:hypothetical protein
MKLLVTLGTLALLATPALAAAPTSQATVTLAPVGGSNARGTALLTQSAKTLEVGVTMKLPQGAKVPESGEPVMSKSVGAAMPAHIHRGSCPNPNPKPLYPLNPVIKGSSTTTLTQTDMSKLTSGNYAIVVYQKSGKMIACGDIKQANPSGTTQ